MTLLVRGTSVHRDSHFAPVLQEGDRYALLPIAWVLVTREFKYGAMNSNKVHTLQGFNQGHMLQQGDRYALFPI